MDGRLPAIISVNRFVSSIFSCSILLLGNVHISMAHTPGGPYPATALQVGTGPCRAPRAPQILCPSREGALRCPQGLGALPAVSVSQPGDSQGGDMAEGGRAGGSSWGRRWQQQRSWGCPAGFGVPGHPALPGAVGWAGSVLLGGPSGGGELGGSARGHDGMQVAPIARNVTEI